MPDAFARAEDRRACLRAVTSRHKPTTDFHLYHPARRPLDIRSPAPGTDAPYPLARAFPSFAIGTLNHDHPLRTTNGTAIVGGSVIPIMLLISELDIHVSRANSAPVDLLYDRASEATSRMKAMFLVWLEPTVGPEFVTKAAGRRIISDWDVSVV